MLVVLAFIKGHFPLSHFHSCLSYLPFFQNFLTSMIDPRTHSLSIACMISMFPFDALSSFEDMQLSGPFSTKSYMCLYDLPIRANDARNSTVNYPTSVTALNSRLLSFYGWHFSRRQSKLKAPEHLSDRTNFDSDVMNLLHISCDRNLGAHSRPRH